MKRFLTILVVMWLCTAFGRTQQRVENAFVERPKVGLVLSGGGARGAAHVGVIRLLEELQIPIDYVAGTSMGAIVGALYAIGYTADEMDSLLMTRDWKMLLSNGVPRTMQPYAQRMAGMHYQVNIPYTNSIRTENSIRYRDAGIKVRKYSNGRFPKMLARPGLIDGQNLSDEFAALTFAYHDSIDYRMLPRPFACVATDLVTGEAVVLDRGFIAESMRASMSIPGVFYPVYEGSQVLVDGGVVNNYPVDVARDMGADIIIGVDLSTGKATADNLHSFASIFERLIGTMGLELHKHNIRDTDILIKPEVGDYPVMGFDTVRLKQLVKIGYGAAARNRTQLDALKKRLDLFISPSSGYGGEKAVSLGTAPLPEDEKKILARIDVLGADHTEVTVLLAQYGVAAGEVLDEATLNRAVEHIYGLGTYSSIQYHLTGNGPYVLQMKVTPNPYNQVEVGLRLDSEDAAAALFCIGINRLKLSGPKLDFTTRVSINPWIEVHTAYAWNGIPQLNASVKYWFSDVNRFYDKSGHSFNYHYYGSDIYLSDIFSRDYDLRLGARYDYFLVRDLVRHELPERSYTDTESRESYVGLYASLRNDLFNTAYLPTSGYAYGAEVAYNIKSRSGEGTNFWVVQADASAAVSVGDATVLQPSAYIRFLSGKQIPFVYGNSIGGYLTGRYMRQQIPFVGITGNEFMERRLAVAKIELRQRIMADVYLSGIANYAFGSDRWESTAPGRDIWGFGAGLVYDTTVGPVSLYGHWNDLHHQFGAYFSFGYNF